MRKLFKIIRDFWSAMSKEEESLFVRIGVMLIMLAFLVLPGIFILLMIISAVSIMGDGDE